MSDLTDTSLEIAAPKRRGLLADFLIRLLREKPLGTVCGLIVLVLLFAGIFADLLAPYPYAEIHLESILEEPSGQYLLGTDQLGRDVLSRLIHGARISLVVGLAATTVNVVVAVLIGGISGFFGGKLDLAVQRFVDAWMAFPGLLLLLTVMSIVGQGIFQIIVVLGIAGGIVGSRVVRSAVIGGISGFIGGKLDLAAQRFVDAWMAFPGLLILLTIMSIVGRGLPQIIVVLGIAGGIGGSRVVRSAVIGIKENDYFLAAQAVGTPTTQILIRHVLPNIMAPVIIIFSINIGGVIISEASLSFLGFGLPPEVPSWGGLLSREGRQYMEMAPWLAFWPGLCLTIVVYSLKMFGDAMRDLLDPRLRGGEGSYGTAKRKRKPGLLARLINPFNG